jgi:hypothetical protein
MSEFVVYTSNSKESLLQLELNDIYCLNLVHTGLMYLPFAR